MEEATARIASKLQVQYEECPTGYGSVGDPDPDPQDPHVFGPPVSGSSSQRYGSGSGPFPFLILIFSFLRKILAKNLFFSLKLMCLRASYKKKI